MNPTNSLEPIDIVATWCKNMATVDLPTYDLMVASAKSLLRKAAQGDRTALDLLERIKSHER